MQTDFDIAICGAGPVGLALAALLVKHGKAPDRIALIDAKTIEQSAQDPRSIALSYGSQQILQGIGAWPIAATAIHQIHVSRRGRFGRTLIDRAEYTLPALGHVTRYGALVTALHACVADTGVKMIRPQTVSAITQENGKVTLNFAEHAALTAQLVVQAEGGIYNEQSKKNLHRDYEQTAIVAHVDVSAAIAHRAFERFTDEGPLALLPQEQGYALVWCVRPQTATRLLALPDADFLQELGRAFGTRLGHFTASSKRIAFPLGLNAKPDTSERLIAIGNAAQTLHPVAGQGLNLGLRDATVLAQLLGTEPVPEALNSFAEKRRTDRNTTIHLTDLMARVFADNARGIVSQTLLGISLGVVDAVQPAKKFLAEQMMFGRRP